MRIARAAALWVAVTAGMTYEAAVHPKLQSACVLAAVALVVILCARRSDAANKPRAEGVHERRRVVK